MAERDHEHPFLPVGRPIYGSRTFLGGSKLSTRTGLFVAIGLAAVVAFSGLIVHVNDRMAAAQRGLDQANKLTAAVTAVERGHAALVAAEKRYLLTRDPEAARAMRSLLDDKARRLDALAALPGAAELERAIATLRDGLVQYDQHLTALASSHPFSPADAGQALRDADAALAPRLATLGRKAAPALLAQADQLGSEMTMTGDPLNMDRLQDAYRELGEEIDRAGLPRGERQVLSDLLARHQSAMMALITARVGLNEEALRFDDIQSYIAPSFDALRQVAGELLDERLAQMTEARTTAAAALVGGGGAIILWLLALGLIVMRSLTRPVQALAEAAQRLALGDRVVAIPGRGNSDAIGTLARAFDNWIAAMADAEHLRQDLEHAQAKTLQAVEAMTAATDKAQAATDQAEALRRTLADYRREMDEMEALLADMAAEPAVTAADDEDAEIVVAREPQYTTALARAQAQAAAQRDPSGEPALAQVSDHLSAVSRQASAAIVDVELTDALMRNLGAARSQMADLEGHVVQVREQFNQFLFAKPQADPGKTQPGKPGQAGNAVALSGGALRQASLNDPDARRRLAAIRDAVDRAERTLAGVAREIDRVTDAAQRLSAQASAEARMATEQLAAQSEYLKVLLDTLGHRDQPRLIGEPAAQVVQDKTRPQPVGGAARRSAAKNRDSG